MSPVPAQRVRAANAAPARSDAGYVLYWMTAARRTRWSFGLDRALEWCRQLGRPLLVFEALRADYPHASARIHRFVIDGMEDNSCQLERARVAYYPYVEPEPGAGKGLLESLSRRACVVVTDDSPAFFLPRASSAAAGRLPVLLEAVDGNGLVPLTASERDFKTAHSFRAFLQKTIVPHLLERPRARPLSRLRIPSLERLPREVVERWPPGLDRQPNVDPSIPPVPFHGGPVEADRVLHRFLAERLPRYAQERNQPEEDVTSGLSPYLHFGHVSSHEIFARLTAAEDWTLDRLSEPLGGSREGFWGLSRGGEQFLDQLVTWRELGFHTAARLPAYDNYESLPEWSLATLAEHATDPRPALYTLEELEAARTHDPLWNAAQVQLRTEGRIHNYLRMLWGKKFLEWSPSPQEALAAALTLNDRWAVDGRDPNSVSGVFWCFGRYDRAWGPERPIFGKVRYMSSENTARKLRVRRYLQRYRPPTSPTSAIEPKVDDKARRIRAT